MIESNITDISRSFQCTDQFPYILEAFVFVFYKCIYFYFYFYLKIIDDFQKSVYWQIFVDSLKYFQSFNIK